MNGDSDRECSEGRSEFSYPSANMIVSRNGFSVDMRDRYTIRYAEAGRVMEIFAEPLVSPEPKIIVRQGNVRWQDADREPQVTDAERDRIVANIRRALAFKGWILLVE